jgi:uncharacterized protein YcbX
MAGNPDSIGGIWRYPVKSMAGEELPAATVTPRGLLGDRAYALVDKSSNRAATVRTWASALLNYSPRFLAEPELDTPPPQLRIRTPDGRELSTADPDIEQQLSASLGREITVMAAAPPGLLVEFPAGTLGGKFSDTTEVPLAGGAPAGTFFDYGSVHLITTSTIDHLQRSYPQGRFDVRRFRPNMIIRSQGEPYAENSWTGKSLAIGDEVVLRITIPCPRCVNTTLPQGDLPHDSGILRTIAQQNRQDLGDFGKLPCAGVYADVLKPGAVHRGDAVRYVD